MRHDNVLLAVCIVGSMSAGVLLPAAGMLVEPYILVWLGALLFFNLIRLNIPDLVATFTRPRQLVVLSAVKLVVLPLGMYVLTYFLYQPFALSVLLLSGISTGLGAPFLVNLIGGRLPIVVGMIIATSLAVPFVLPALVYALVGSQLEIPVLHMVILLVAALFTPLAGGWFTKRHFPTASRFADENSFLLSLIFIVLINFGMFAKFSSYFYEEQLFLLQTIVTAFLCYAAYGIVGYVTSAGDRHDRNAGLISMSYINNVLVAVLAFQFFGPQVAVLAAIYNIPYYAGIVVIKKFMSGQ
ncbi:MAG TPA: arsenic resistance protein [Nitrososphaera sp.]|nr:arsenic resistance protein [Nitrososphaera sp.]